MNIFYRILVLQNYKGYNNFNLLSFNDVSKFNNNFLVYYEIYNYKYYIDNFKSTWSNFQYDLINRINDVEKNKFLNSEKRNELCDVYTNAKRIYNKFCRIAYLFKLKKSKPSTFDTDLTLFPLDDLSKNSKMTLYDETSRTIYNFRISDIINIINNCLSEAPYYFVEPIPIKNPQTNVKFTYASLYNLYFKLRESTYIMPLLFKLYFLSNFDFEVFVRNNEAIIRDHAIVKNSKNMSDKIKVEHIKLLIYDYDTIRRPLRIHEEFPNDKLIKAFGCVLTDFLLFKYSMNQKVREDSNIKIDKYFTHFKKCNPNFGKKMTKKSIEQILPINRKMYNINTSRDNKYVFYFIDNIFENIIDLYNYKEIVEAELQVSKVKTTNTSNNTVNKNKSKLSNIKNKNKNNKYFKTFDFITSPINIVINNEYAIAREYAEEFVTKTITYIIDYLEMCDSMETLTI